jgi:hypothetical protein
LALQRPPDDEEVVSLCTVARERSLAGDLVNFLYLDLLEARRLAHQGSSAEGTALARKTVEVADTTDNYDMRSHGWASLAEALHTAGEPDEAARAAAEAIAIRVAKGDVAGAAALRSRFAEIGLAPAS